MPSIRDSASSIFSGLNSIALSPSGNVAAVCLNDRELHFYRIVEAPWGRDPSQSANLESGRSPKHPYLEETQFLRLPQERYHRPTNAEVSYACTKLAFLDEDTLLVAREISQVGGGDEVPPEEPANTSLIAIQIRSGELVAEFTDSAYGPLFAAPLLIPPKYVLFPTAETAICIDAASFREVSRLPSASEQIHQNSIAYDPASGTLYVLWWQFESSFLQTYRLDAESGTINELKKQPMAPKGLEANSLYLRKDGKEIAVWFTAVNEVVRRRTLKDGMYSGETGRLGHLGLFSPDGDRYLEVQSTFERYFWRTRDFLIRSMWGAKELSIRYAVDEHYMTKPFYLDDRTVVINTPGGVLLAVDTETGACAELADASSPIEDLCVHPEKGLLLVGTKGKGDVPSALLLLRLA
jgi:hypothetical protein